MKKSLIIPFHDGEPYLKYSLPALAHVDVDEFVIVFDRVSSNMKRLFDFYFPKNQRSKCKFVVRNNPSEVNCKSVNVSEKHLKDWNHVRAKMFSMGISFAEGDLLFVSAEDIILDKRNFDEKFWKDSNVGFVDFRYMNYCPVGGNIRNAFGWAVTNLLDHFTKKKATQRSGVFGVRRTVYDEVGGIDDVPTEEDWLRKKVVACGYKHVHVTNHCDNIHMRTCMDKTRQLLQGKSRFRQGYTFLRALAHSILWLKPYVIIGYIQERQKVG